MSRRLLTLCAALALPACWARTAPAAEIYKSVDANGVVTYSDHADPAMPQTSVVEWQDPRYPPHELHFCWENCFTLIYDGQAFHRTDGEDETWTVEKFTAGSVVLHRHSAPAQWNGFSADVTYAASVSNDRLVGVMVNGKPTAGIDASWGIALNTLPGSDAERDARLAAGARRWNAVASAPDRASLAAASDSAVIATVAPPPIPDDSQPAASQDGYLWTPGYWYWGGKGYTWVTGAWLEPPAVGLLWTPAYWSFADGRYFFHTGYWGPHVGFYGGINYGFGYYGSGFAGGRWVGNSFAYNSSVNHLNPSVIHNTYVETVSGRTGHGSVSYNGGPGGTAAVATSQERIAAIEAHLPATATPARTVVRVVSAAPAGQVVPPGRAVSLAQHTNVDVPKPVVVNQSVQARTRTAVNARTPVDADGGDQMSRSAAARGAPGPALRVGRAPAPKAPSKP